MQPYLHNPKNSYLGQRDIPFGPIECRIDNQEILELIINSRKSFGKDVLFYHQVDGRAGFIRTTSRWVEEEGKTIHYWEAAPLTMQHLIKAMDALASRKTARKDKR